MVNMAVCWEWVWHLYSMVLVMAQAGALVAGYAYARTPVIHAHVTWYGAYWIAFFSHEVRQAVADAFPARPLSLRMPLTLWPRLFSLNSILDRFLYNQNGLRDNIAYLSRWHYLQTSAKSKDRRLVKYALYGPQMSGANTAMLKIISNRMALNITS